jgi:hypothetical protein
MTARPSPAPAYPKESTMGKAQDAKKETKKAPAMSKKEKKAAKIAKKAGKSG